MRQRKNLIFQEERTIADLEGVSEVGERHILEALQYRPKRGAGINH